MTNIELKEKYLKQKNWVSKNIVGKRELYSFLTTYLEICARKEVKVDRN
jgi:hypothetical protein